MKEHRSHPLPVRLFLPCLTLLWGAGCGTLEAEPRTDEALPEPTLAQVEQAQTVTYTLHWADNQATGDCHFVEPRNGLASGRLEEPRTITGLAGKRIRSMHLSSTNNAAFKYDDVLLLNFNNYILMSSDRRVAGYSNAPNPLGTSPVQYVWSKILGQPIDNQNLQPAWCTSGATGADCTVPRTETVGTMNVNLPSFSAIDEAAYPSLPDARTFTLVTIGDDEQYLDCRHGDVTLTLTVEGCTPQPEVCDGKDNDCDDRIDEDLGTVTCGVGACKRTVEACINGAPGICTPGSPTPETRDNIDNNCNGYVDENFIVSVPVSTLSSFIGTCTSTDLNSTVGYSRACVAAARRYCNSRGWEGGTPIEYGPPNVYLACFRAKGFFISLTELNDPDCTATKLITTPEYSKACTSATSRYCAIRGYVGGIPQEFDGSKIYINCVDQQPSSNGYFGSVDNTDWAWRTNCLSSPLAGPEFSKGCRAAAHRWCAYDQNAVSGVPVDVGATMSNLACIYL
ncbi:MopE-related protein [Archangium violaceum]|uniref:MopE-related protein n=1 Tax=Archangium violaceum TaxID=83451 RepID=UPI0036D9FE46